jgi:hypothetical protein
MSGAAPFLALNSRASAACGGTVGLRNQCYSKVCLADALLNQRNPIRYSPLSTFLSLAKVKTKNRQGYINGECSRTGKEYLFPSCHLQTFMGRRINFCCAAAEGLRLQAPRRK